MFLVFFMFVPHSSSINKLRAAYPRVKRPGFEAGLSPSPGAEFWNEGLKRAIKQPDSFDFEDVTDRLSRNVGTLLRCLKSQKISFRPWRKN